MKSLRMLLAAFAFLLVLGSVKTATAQCAMCSTMVDTNNKSGATTTKGLNNGVLYLLAAPYLAVGVVGFVWYRKYRRKSANVNMA